MKNTTIATRVSHGLMAVALAATLGLVGCSSDTSTDDTTDDTTTEETTEEASSGTQLSAPTDLEIDWETGEFTFTATDEGVSYYFLRAYSYEDGVVGDEYIATSSRITGNTTGTLSGTLDLSELGYSTYCFRLVGFAASGTDDVSPDAVEVVYQLGVGAVFERPEFMVLTDGSMAEFYIDLYTLTDWNKYQIMPTIEFNIYSDADCTELVRTETVDLSDLEPVAETVWSAGSTYWTVDEEALHVYLTSSDGTTSAGLVTQLVLEDLDAGTYYVTVTALASDDGLVSESQVSDVLEFTVTSDEATGEYTAVQSSMWADPELSSFGALANKGTYTDRIDFAGSQTTGATVVE